MDGPPPLLPPPPPAGIARHAGDTLRLGMPLAVAQLMQMAMGATDTILLGGLGGGALAAGGLGGSIMITALVILQGVLTAVSVMVAQAQGAGRAAEVPGLYWTGHLLTLLLMLPAFLLFTYAEPLLLLVGEPADLSRDVGVYLGVLRWCTPGALLGLGLLRAFLPAVGGGGIILGVTVVETLANGVLCYGLIHGRWGLPAMGLTGAALATVIVITLGALGMLALVHLGRTRRFVTWSAPRWGVLGAMLRLGVPVSATFAVESGLFLAVGLLMGLLGQAALAAQQVALSTVSIAFMIPLGIAQAANVRVGRYAGARDARGARRAGLVAVALAGGFELVAALVVLAVPERIVGLYIDHSDAAAFAIAVRLLGVATLFQVADGVQCAAGGALRGLGDTRVPFLCAALGYWGIGFPAAWWMTLRTDAGPAGAWYGLAAGLVVVAVLLTWRFHRRAAGAVPPPAITGGSP